METAALRTEIKTARESVQELQLGQDSCVWRLWVQQWLLRLSLVFDILLVVWIIWEISNLPSTPITGFCGDRRHLSSETEGSEPEPAVPLKTLPLVSGKESGVRGRPSRPSDFQGGK